MRKLLMLLMIASFFAVSCSEEEKVVEVEIGEGKIFPLGDYSCVQVRNPPDTGLMEDIEGPYHVEFGGITITSQTKNAVEIQSIFIEYEVPGTSDIQTCAFGRLDIQAFFSSHSTDERNKGIFVNGRIAPTDAGDPPYTIQNVSLCSVSCGGLAVQNASTSFTLTGQATVQGTIHGRDETGKETGERDAFVEVVPVRMSYL